VIDSGVSIELCNSIANSGTCTQASNNWFANVNDLRGDVTAIAPDKSGSHIYVLSASKMLTESTGFTLPPMFRPAPPAGQRAALPSIGVKDDGTVVLMYDTFNAQDGKVNVHIASSDSFGATISSDIDEYNFTLLALSALVPGPCNTTSCPDREFGD
jgi:hypothetical protein